VYIMPQCTNACKAWERGLSGERLRKARHLPACSQTEQMQGRLHIKELLGETNGMKPPEIGYSGEITKRLARAGGTPRGWAAHWRIAELSQEQCLPLCRGRTGVRER
jgi:hypothetical protein